jgi:2,3-bisphosphoglycerate-independent phosphoglycerate mutase
MRKKAVLIIMDGFGLAPAGPGNAVSTAKKPNIDRLFSENPFTRLSASGLDVGLPEGQMGNSEVGHTNIGAGRVVFQDLPKITRDIETGGFFKNPAYVKAMDDAVENGRPLHILGLLSDGGVHSHIKHIFAILDMAKDRGVKNVYVHCFLDGRDVPPKSGAGLCQDARRQVRRAGQRPHRHHPGPVLRHGPRQALGARGGGLQRRRPGRGRDCPDPAAAVEKSYENGVTDEFVKPVIVCPEGVHESGRQRHIHELPPGPRPGDDLGPQS